MVENDNRVLNNILSLFGKTFLKYNAIVFMLMSLLIFLSLVFKNSFLRALQIIDLFIVIINAIYIAWKIVVWILSLSSSRWCPHIGGWHRRSSWRSSSLVSSGANRHN